jgi:hypothetical protein
LAEVTYTTTFKFKRGQSDAWARVNPILAEGEPGYELDTNKLKIGDGVTAWNDLLYFSGSATISADGKSLNIIGKSLELYDFSAAEANQFPYKGEDGELKWTDRDIPMTEEEIISVLK